MLNYITATDFQSGKDVMINLDHVIKIAVHASGRTEFTDINGSTFLIEEPIENISTAIRLIQATEMYQKGQS